MSWMVSFRMAALGAVTISTSGRRIKARISSPQETVTQKSGSLFTNLILR